MNESAVRQIAQSDPVPSISAKWTDSVVHARKLLDGLTRELRLLDALTDDLAAHDITVSVDLGPIGNAAAAARRDLERERPGRPTFALPAEKTRANVPQIT